MVSLTGITVCTKEFAKYCGMDGARYHNAWARKTYSRRVLLVTLGLGELMWSEEQAISVSGHRSTEQMTVLRYSWTVLRRSVGNGVRNDRIEFR